MDETCTCNTETAHAYTEHHIFTYKQHLSGQQWPLLLTWFSLNPSMDKESHAW